jgi:ectoine hydroxylase-related dioxygenase (phytanoyl-CoA dioxygenase family)
MPHVLTPQPQAVQHHTISYRVLNHQWQNPVREIDVWASPEEIRSLIERGYLVRPALIQGEQLQRLRDALDEVAARELAEQRARFSDSRAFGGLFLRFLEDKHPAFFELIKFAPTLSVARAVLGPLVQIRGLGCRIVAPGEPNSETEWHQHHQYATDPPAPWFVRPHGLDCLFYLDEISEDNGPICVRPGSHRDMVAAELPAELYDDLPDQVELRLPAGSVLMMHATLWHRAKPPTATDRKRRLLLLNYTPTWMKRSPYGVKPEDGLTRSLLESGDREAKELLGVGGYT